jgi:glycosyltransferase involved in cell wall biosynthesis
MTGILRAMRSAGMRVLAVGESDGQMSPRYHAWATFRYMTAPQQTLRGWVGAAKHWGQRFLFRAATEHKALVENVAATDVFTLAGQGCVDEFRRLLCRIGVGHLAPCVVWLPYPVPDEFCSGSARRERADRVIAVGRWDAAQKNPELLERTVRRLAAIRKTEFLIVGRSGSDRFARLAREVPTVRVADVQPRERIRDLLGQSRVLLFSSRWEGCPVSAHEMLAVGGTVVGTPIPSLHGMTADRRFGRTSRRSTAHSLTEAVRAELELWDQGQRDPAMIAAHWRPLVHPAGVARRVLDLLRLPQRAMAETR